MSSLSVGSLFKTLFNRGSRLSAADEALVRERLDQAAKTLRPDARVTSYAVSAAHEGAVDANNPATGTARLRMGGANFDLTFSISRDGGEVRMDSSVKNGQVAVFNGTRFIARVQLPESEHQRRAMRAQIDAFVDNTTRVTKDGPVLEAKNVLSEAEVDAIVALAKGADGKLTPAGKEELEHLVFRSSFSETAKDSYATEAARAEASSRFESHPRFQLTRRSMLALYGAVGVGNPYKAYLDAHPEQ